MFKILTSKLELSNDTRSFYFVSPRLRFQSLMRQLQLHHGSHLSYLNLRICALQEAGSLAHTVSRLDGKLVGPEHANPLLRCVTVLNWSFQYSEHLLFEQLARPACY